MLHRTIITYIVPHVPINKTYQRRTKKYHSFQKIVPNPFYHPKLPFWSWIPRTLSFIYYRCKFSFCNKVFQTFKKQLFYFLKLWSVRTRPERWPEFGYSSFWTRKPSKKQLVWKLFVNWPFWWIYFNRLSLWCHSTLCLIVYESQILTQLRRF